MSDKPWYHKGLRFQCTGCGSCCIGTPGYVWVNKAEIAAMAAALRLEVDQFQRRYVRLVGIRKSLIESQKSFNNLMVFQSHNLIHVRDDFQKKPDIYRHNVTRREKSP